MLPMTHVAFAAFAVAPLPAGSLANGLAENFTTGTLYICLLYTSRCV